MERPNSIRVMEATGEPQATRRIAHTVVEEAIRCFAKLKLKPRGDSMLRVLLGFSALRSGKDDAYLATGLDLQATVKHMFQVLEGPKEFPGTLSLRGSGGAPNWLTNDSYRGSWMDYAGPNKPGRVLFEDADWRKPLRSDAVALVAAAKGPADTWPPRDALAALVLREHDLAPTMSWPEIIDQALDELGLTSDDFEAISSEPLLTELAPFEGEEWDPEVLSEDLRPPSGSTVRQSEETLDALPPQLQGEVRRVLDALRRYSGSAIVALAGVPGTSKSYVGRIAARAYASPGCLREIQFSPGYTYEEFMEGPRFDSSGKLEVFAGIFLDFNEIALKNPDKQFVLLIEELSRADLPQVLGELLTYVEYRGDDDTFVTMYQRNTTKRVAHNLALLATYNPTDRSAVSIDGAIIRRLRILSFPPNQTLLREMLVDNGVDNAAIDQLVTLFEACREAATPERFDEVMPFGHAVFHEVLGEEDLHDLWWQQLRQMLIRPRTPQHELYEVIRDHYPWQTSREFRLHEPSEAVPPEEEDLESSAGIPYEPPLIDTPVSEG